MPERVQLSRKKGWRMPPNTVSVARPTKWGNPFKGEAAAVVDAFRKLYLHRLSLHVGPDQAVRCMAFIPPYVLPDPRELRGKNLACWCKLDAPCHADVLLELANK